MRDIKFRGKDIETGKWVCGFYVRLEDTFRKPIDGKERITHRIYPGFADSCASHDGYDFSGDWHEVDPETIGQFTGETDKNGIQIFEGDVVRLAICPPTYNGKNPNPYEDLRYVAWEQQKRAYVYRKIKEHPGKHSRNIRDVWMGHGKVRTVEVIGNIHDQPELLKGAEP